MARRGPHKMMKVPAANTRPNPSRPFRAATARERSLPQPDTLTFNGAHLPQPIHLTFNSAHKGAPQCPKQ
jgi:hypothetical protein